MEEGEVVVAVVVEAVVVVAVEATDCPLAAAAAEELQNDVYRDDGAR